MHIEELSDVVLETLLTHRGFENFWYDLEDETQEQIRESLQENIREMLDNDEE